MTIRKSTETLLMGRICLGGNGNYLNLIKGVPGRPQAKGGLGWYGGKKRMEVISGNSRVTSIMATPSCWLGQLLAEILAEYKTQDGP